MSHSTPSFTELQQLGFYPDILVSIDRWMNFMHNKRQCEIGIQIAEEFASGYLRARTFSVQPFQPHADDALYDLKSNYLDAVTRIFAKYGDRLPIQFYQTLAFMVLREDPTKDARIPDVAHLLPQGLTWQQADTVLHTFPICYRLSLDIQTTINMMTGRVLGHSCGCNHQLMEMPAGSVNVPMGDKESVLFEETESFLRHGFGQRYLIEFGMPHGLGPSVKMQIADGFGDGQNTYTISESGPHTLQKMVLKLSSHE